jgi:hypothetical protein
MNSVRRQQGVALIVLLTVLVLGVAWFAIGAFGKAAPSAADREVKTGLALLRAKAALLAYVAQYAARFDTAEPGQLPCPEALNLSNVGQAVTNCSNTVAVLGRLPWRTLGIDQLRDGEGEPLWYVISPGFRSAPINFGTQGQLTYDGAGNAAVAVIIAPGRPLNTFSVPGAPPPGCAAVNQQVATRNAATLNPANFIECGNAAGSYANPGSSAWTNDRAIAITAAEWADAIAGAVADRLQRQVAPAMEDWRESLSLAVWGERFLPYASRFDSLANNPSVNSLCGTLDVREGMPPTASVASGTCDTSWSGGNATQLGLLNSGGCAPAADGLRCSFSTILGGLFSPRIDAAAPRIANSFRSFSASQVSISRDGGATWQTASIFNYSGQGVDNASGEGSVRFNVQLPLLSLLESVIVRLGNPVDAGLADTRTQWFINNGWARFTYYAMTRANSSNPGKEKCNPPSPPNPAGEVADCLTVSGAPLALNQQRLVLVLMGRPVAGQVQPAAATAGYLEASNASTGDSIFTANTVVSTFNDRIATCPYKLTDAAGADVTVCN